jgi:cytochrome P450
MSEAFVPVVDAETWRAGEVPGPAGYPLVGALPKMRKDPLRFLVEAASRYGDVVSLGGVGRQRYFLITHPSDVEHVLKGNHRNYVKGANFKLLKSFVGEGLFLSEGGYWRRQRRLIQPAFHLPRLAALAGVMTAETEAMLGRWDELARRGEPVEVERQMMHLSLQIAVKTLFGADVGGHAEAIRAAVSFAFRYLHERVWAIAPLPPWVPTAANRRFLGAVAALDEIVYGIIAERRRSGREGDDVLSMLLAMRDEETGEGMTDREIRDEVMTLLVAGHESTALTLTWTLYLASRHGNIERRLHRELDAALGGRNPGFADVPKLAYASMFLRECMRLYPAFWMFTRTPLADDELGGHRIPAGSVVVLSSYVTHRHRGFWRNPEGVDPERFAPENAGERPPFAYFPFGGGPRQCIGNRLAEYQTLIVLATIARRYSLHLVAGHPVEPQATLSLRPRHGVRMLLEARQASPAPEREEALVSA